MKLREYLKSKSLYISCSTFAIIFLAAVLNAHKLEAYSIIYICMFVLAGFLIPFLAEYFQKRGFYNYVKSTFELLDKKFLLAEMLEEPEFFEGDFLYELIKRSDKAMNDEIAKYKFSTQEHKEYIEKWVHEIKTPISACMLAVENNKQGLSDGFSEDLEKIDKYVTQTLFYSRVSNVEKDYIIKEKSLNDLVSSSLRANSKQLIHNGFSIKRDNLDLNVLTDEKWISFILEQIISNSIKYKSDNPTLKFTGIAGVNSVILEISDNGIGIDSADLPRIFEKNFTGGNGRLNKKSTGFGLYLCKNLCKKLSIEISARSDNGTTISLLFPLTKL